MSAATAVEIVPWAPRHADAFRALNLAWIEEHFAVEEIDRRQLGDPEASILRPGGAILVAEEPDGTAIGVCALLAAAPGRYEVSKMAVRADRRGCGVGRRLLREVVAHARRIGAQTLFIRSNTVLAPAIHLYRAFGFREVAVPAEREYARCNISLELALEEGS